MQVSKISNSNLISMKANPTDQKQAQNTTTEKKVDKKKVYTAAAAAGIALIAGAVIYAKSPHRAKKGVEGIMAQATALQEGASKITKEAQEAQELAKKQFDEVLGILNGASKDNAGKFVDTDKIKFVDGLMKEVDGDKVVRSTEFAKDDKGIVIKVINLAKENGKTDRFEFDKDGVLKRVIEGLEEVKDKGFKAVKALIFGTTEKDGKSVTKLTQKLTTLEGTEEAFTIGERTTMADDVVSKFEKVIKKAKEKDETIEEFFNFDGKNLVKYENTAKKEALSLTDKKAEYTKEDTKYTFDREDGKLKKGKKSKVENTDKKDDKKPAEQKPAEQKPAEQKPAEQKPAEQKPAEQKPAEQKPVEGEQPAAQPEAPQAEVQPEAPKNEVPVEVQADDVSQAEV